MRQLVHDGFTCSLTCTDISIRGILQYGHKKYYFAARFASCWGWISCWIDAFRGSLNVPFWSDRLHSHLKCKLVKHRIWEFLSCYGRKSAIKYQDIRMYLKIMSYYRVKITLIIQFSAVEITIFGASPRSPAANHFLFGLSSVNMYQRDRKKDSPDKFRQFIHRMNRASLYF